MYLKLQDVSFIEPLDADGKWFATVQLYHGGDRQTQFCRIYVGCTKINLLKQPTTARIPIVNRFWPFPHQSYCNNYDAIIDRISAVSVLSR